MARLTNSKTGAVVQVRDEKVEAMGSDWEPVKAEAKKAPAKKAAAKSNKS